jgi:hypothetical protein
MISHVKEGPLESLHRDLVHLFMNTALGLNPPLAQLSNLLGQPLVTGRRVGGMKAPPEVLPEGILVGLRTPNLSLRTLGTKIRDSAKTCTMNLYSPSSSRFCLVSSLVDSRCSCFRPCPLRLLFFFGFYSHAPVLTLVQSFLLCTGCVWGELYLILVSNSPNSLSGSHLRSAHLPFSS